MASSQASKTNKDETAAEPKSDQQQQTQPKPAAALEEDDEFEDFPVDDWTAEETEAANSGEGTQHLWEESWDDDDTSDDFSTQLKEELKKVEESKRR